ncbi:MAG: ERF family protein [Alphaproteobacteria bacterium]|nr:ERF family protein [Alphaproteobacteria bacterium]
MSEKLAKIIKELNAPKSQRNTFGNYNYRSAEDILEAVKPLLDGAILNISDDILVVGTDKDTMRYYIKATATFIDGDFKLSSTAFAREPLSKKGQDEPQITGTASSYARKYALNGLFCIDDNKDPDTDEYHKQTNRPDSEEVKKARGFIKDILDQVPVEADTSKYDNYTEISDVKQLRAMYTEIKNTFFGGNNANH